MTGRRTLLHICALGALLWLSGCGGDDPLGPEGAMGPEEPDTAQPGESLVSLSDAMIVNLQLLAIRGYTGSVGSVSGSGDPVAYVAFPPGTFPGADSTRIRNRATGTARVEPLVDGGLDPVPVPAQVGDTIEITVGQLQLLVPVPLKRPPIVIRTSPPRGQTDVPLNWQIIIVFSEPVRTETLTPERVRLLRGVESILVTLERRADGFTIVLTPDIPLEPETNYTLMIDTGIEDLAGDTLQQAEGVTFTTVPNSVDPPEEPDSPPPDGAWASVAGGESHTCGLTVAGTAYCWGSNEQGQLGTGQAGAGLNELNPVLVAGGTAFTALAAGESHSCGITVAGTLLCWGENESGQLGDGSLIPSPLPISVASNQVFASVGAGSGYTCALTVSGEALCWGRNDWGQLADGTQTARSSPAQVSGVDLFAELSVGQEHACGVTSDDGRPLCWGRNSGAQVGSDTTVHAVLSPRLATEAQELGLRVQSVSPGREHTCIISLDRLWWGCWGEWAFRTHVYPEAPAGITCWIRQEGEEWIQIDCLTAAWSASNTTGPFVALADGYEHSCALTQNGGAFCWGSDGWGQRGDAQSGGIASRANPVEGLTFSAIAAGAYHTCGIATSGEAYCWGRNDSGQLGIGTQGWTVLPTRVTLGP